jgi:hypothetical protein
LMPLTRVRYELWVAVLQPFQAIVMLGLVTVWPLVGDVKVAVGKTCAERPTGLVKSRPQRMPK